MQLRITCFIPIFSTYLGIILSYPILLSCLTLRIQNHKLIVTVILLLCTIKTGGHPLQSTSKSLKYPALASALLLVPSSGLGNVVNITAVSLLCRLISSFRIKCWARHGKSLKDNGRAWVEYVDPRRDWVGEGFSDTSEMWSGREGLGR